MDIELYLILSTTYKYVSDLTAWGISHDDQSRQYILHGIETYFRKHGYTYDAGQKEWTTQAKLDEIARRRTQGAKDGWKIRRGKQHKDV